MNKTTVNTRISNDLNATKPIISCLCCESALGNGNPRKRFCRGKCRILYWAIQEIIKEFKAGKANGLREFIKELAKEATKP
jgi:hypothetical protein